MPEALAAGLIGESAGTSGVQKEKENRPVVRLDLWAHSGIGR